MYVSCAALGQEFKRRDQLARRALVYEGSVVETTNEASGSKSEDVDDATRLVFIDRANAAL